MKKCIRIMSLVLMFSALISIRSIQSFAEETGYTNTYSGYRAVIIDNANLLSSWEEEDVLSAMIPITEYGNIAVYTTDEKSSTSYSENARLKRKSLFGFEDASLFMIDMYNRKLYIQSYGNMYDVFTKSQATNITNNTAKYATAGEYGTCTVTAMRQMLSLLEGNAVPQTMKFMSNACIALIAGLLLGFCAVRKRFDLSTMEKPGLEQIEGDLTVDWEMGEITSYHKSERIYSPPSYDSGGSSSGCGGGGGGGCGGGGGSSF